MGNLQTKSPALKELESKLHALATKVKDAQYDLNHTTDIDFRKSIKTRALTPLTRELIEIQQFLEDDENKSQITEKQQIAIQLILDGLTANIQKIEGYH